MAAFVKWMAATDSTEALEASANCPVFVNRFDKVRTARGREPTVVAQHWA